MTQQRTQEFFDEVLAIVRSDLANGRVTTYGDRLLSLVKSGRSRNWRLWDALKAARRAVGQIEETPR